MASVASQVPRDAGALQSGRLPVGSGQANVSAGRVGPLGLEYTRDVARTVELGGINVVGVGAFNPAIFHPTWLAEKDLLPNTVASAATEHDQFAFTRELSAFTADWLIVQVTLEQAIFATVEEGRELDLRDLARGVFDLLPETPIDAVGINSDAHFRVEDEAAWHAVGDQFLPKDFWQPMFEDDRWRRREDGATVGLRTMTVEAHRDDVRGYVRMEVGPSVRVMPFGVYVGTNAHFQLSEEGSRGNGYVAARTVDEHWEDTRELERELLDRFLQTA